MKSNEGGRNMQRSFFAVGNLQIYTSSVSSREEKLAVYCFFLFFITPNHVLVFSQKLPKWIILRLDGYTSLGCRYAKHVYDI